MECGVEEVHDQLAIKIAQDIGEKLPGIYTSLDGQGGSLLQEIGAVPEGIQGGLDVDELLCWTVLAEKGGYFLLGGGRHSV